MFGTSSDPPPGMTWRETITPEGATSVYFSGPEPPKGLVRIAWALVLLGVFYELLFNVLMAGGTTRGSVVAMQATPLAIMVVGGALAWKWRLGGPSSSMLEIGRANARFSRGFWQNPLDLARTDVREVAVRDHAQNYQVVRDDSWGYVQSSFSETARWFQVVLVTRAGDRHVVACFGEKACALFHAQRMTTMLGISSS